MATYIINRKPQIRAYYTHDGSMPSITIMQGSTVLRQARGSSLGPRNPTCDPAASDIAYWRSLVDLPADDAEVAAALASTKRTLLQDAKCPTCGDQCSQEAIDALGQCTNCEDRTDREYRVRRLTD